MDRVGGGDVRDLAVQRRDGAANGTSDGAGSDATDRDPADHRAGAAGLVAALRAAGLDSALPAGLNATLGSGLDATGNAALHAAGRGAGNAGEAGRVDRRRIRR